MKGESDIVDILNPCKLVGAILQFHVVFLEDIAKLLEAILNLLQ